MPSGYITSGGTQKSSKTFTHRMRMEGFERGLGHYGLANAQGVKFQS